MGNIRNYPGIYRGVVFSNRDPLNQRRLRLLVPAVFGDSPTQWAWPVETAGVVLAPPAVKQGVWVMFENGDPSFPLWVGTFGKWSDSSLKTNLTPSAQVGAGISTSQLADGSTVVDLLNTIIALEQRITALETAGL